MEGVVVEVGAFAVLDVAVGGVGVAFGVREGVAVVLAVAGFGDAVAGVVVVAGLAPAAFFEAFEASGGVVVVAAAEFGAVGGVSGSFGDFDARLLFP